MKYNFPKVELHLHLDGSLDLYEAQDMALAQGLMRPEEGILALRRRMEVQPDCQSLEEYLRCFRLPGLLLQSAEALERASYRLLCNCVADGVAYAEVRFAPQLHMQAGLKQEDAIEAVLHGMQRACAELPIDAGLLLCAMVTGGEDVDKQNALTFELAGAYRKSGVVGVDLAGAEGKRPMEDFRPLFQRESRSRSTRGRLLVRKRSAPRFPLAPIALGMAVAPHNPLPPWICSVERALRWKCARQATCKHMLCRLWHSTRSALSGKRV